MSTDVVVFRTQRIVPRMAAPSRLENAAVPPSNVDPLSVPGSIEEIDGGHGAADALVERLAAARARLGQLTFYLLDAESWR